MMIVMALAQVETMVQKKSDGASEKFTHSPVGAAQCPPAISLPCKTLAELVAKTPEGACALKYNYLIAITCQS